MWTSWIVPTGWLLLVAGSLIYVIVNAYQKVQQFGQAHYQLLPGQVLPKPLSRQADWLQQTRYHYLAAYDLKLPSAFKRTPPIAYTFQSDDGTSIAMLTQHRNMQSTGFQSLFPDDALLVTIQGIPASPLLQIGTDEKYELNRVSGGLDEAYAYHKKKLEAFELVHGSPLSIQTPSEYLDRMNGFMLEHTHKRLVESTVKIYRGILGLVVLVPLSINFLLFAAQRVSQDRAQYSVVMLASSAPFIFLGGVVAMFMRQIKQKYVKEQSPAE